MKPYSHRCVFLDYAETGSITAAVSKPANRLSKPWILRSRQTGSLTTAFAKPVNRLSKHVGKTTYNNNNNRKNSYSYSIYLATLLPYLHLIKSEGQIYVHR